jgi:hypothetical protein
MTKQTRFALRLNDVATMLGDSPGVDRLELIAGVLAVELTENEFALSCRQVMIRDLKIPAPAKFIQYAKGQNRDKAEIEIGRVFDAIKRHGSYDAEGARMKLGENTWDVIKRMGGWAHLCTMSLDQLGTYRAQFLNCSERSRDHVERVEALAALPGGTLVMELAAGLANKKSLQGDK